jgi:hypothetical protein
VKVRKVTISAFILFYGAVCGVVYVHAGIGLRVRFTEAIIEGLNVGYTYNIRELGRLPYTVINDSDKEVEVETVVEVPNEKQLMENYEPIPSVDWIKVVPSRVKLLPGEEKSADVIIAIPPDERYANRHFQAMLWSYTVSIGGEVGMFNVGVRSRIRFSTGKAPERLRKEKVRRGLYTYTLNLDLTPASLYLFDIEPGRKYRLSELTEEKLKLTNRGDVKFKVKFLCVVPSTTTAAVSLPAGYECIPDVSSDGVCRWIKISPQEFVIKPNTIKEINLTVEIPKEEKYYNKKYMCLIKGEVYTLAKPKNINIEVPVEIISRVYISTIAK